VAAGAGLALADALGAAVVGALGDPLDAGGARVEHGDLLGGDLGPVGSGESGLAAQGQHEADGGGDGGLLEHGV